MKRIGYLFEKIVNLENLYLAELKAGRGKSRSSEVMKFRENLDWNLYKLHNELVNQTYIVSKYYNFVIYEPKKRNISKLPYVDRIVHHAVILHLEPIFTKMFISQTYACIKYRGIHRALNKLTEYIRGGG